MPRLPAGLTPLVRAMSPANTDMAHVWVYVLEFEGLERQLVKFTALVYFSKNRINVGGGHPIEHEFRAMHHTLAYTVSPQQMAAPGAWPNVVSFIHAGSKHAALYDAVPRWPAFSDPPVPLLDVGLGNYVAIRVIRTMHAPVF